MKMKSCLAARLETCSDKVVNSVNRTLTEKLGWVKGHCDPSMDEPKYSECNLTGAKQCLHSLVMSFNTSKEMCM